MDRQIRGPGRPKDEDLAARRREEILAAATRLFAATGYRTGDVQVLADRLGVGKGTVYRYFPSKEALFFAAVDAGMQALVACVNAASADETDPIEHMKKTIRAYLGFFDRNPDLVELLIIERAEFRDRDQGTYFVYKDRQQAERRAFVEHAMQAGVIRKMPPERIINFIGDCLYGVIFTNHFARRKVPFDQQAEDIIDILLNGIFQTDARAG
jgi:AcrR family transcriptional regulator